jgi:hypothetical protein
MGQSKTLRNGIYVEKDIFCDESTRKRGLLVKGGRDENEGEKKLRMRKGQA